MYEFWGNTDIYSMARSHEETMKDPENKQPEKWWKTKRARHDERHGARKLEMKECGQQGQSCGLR